MALKKSVQDVLNKQINTELWSGYLYLSMSAYLEEQGLSGFANWMKVHYHEENAHAMKIYEYIIERNGQVVLEPIPAVDHKWNGVLDLFESFYEHEQKITEIINCCMTVAIEEKDYATISMLQWFVDEQVEEEAHCTEILDKLKIIGNDGQSLYMMNEKMRERTFVNPTKG